MSLLMKEYRCGSVAWSHRELQILTLFNKLTFGHWIKGFPKSRVSPANRYLESIGTADTKITSCERGRIRLNGSWWFALSNSNITIYPGQKVRVTSRQNQTLLVELSQYS